VFASIAAFAGLYASADHQVSVLVMAQTVNQGQLIKAADLTQVSLAVSGGLTPIPVSDAPELSGRRAVVTIPAGSLLTPTDLTTSSPIPAGDAVVGVALKAGQLPSPGLVPGDQVMIVQTEPPGTAVDTPGASSAGQDSESSVGVLVPQASVYDVETPSVGSSADITQLVSVEVAATLASAVSAAAASEQLSLVLLPPSTANGTGNS
jgi:hypothetical protein